MVVSTAVILWAGIRRLHGRIEANVQAFLEDEHLPAHAPQIVRDLMMSDVAGELRVETMTLDQSTWAAGKRLSELELRSATGSSLILLERGDSRTEAPGPDTILLPGDRLTLIGTRGQLTSARAVLSRPVPTGPVRTELRLGRLYVAEASHLDGKRLADAGLRNRAGLQVIAILRENKAIPNPGGEERFQAGDVLLVLGPQEQIAAATSLVGPRAAGRPGAPAA
jgi:K+/H+ antiporter YhaU regulatory subunit KhtT